MKFTQMKSTIFKTMSQVFWFLLSPSNLNFLSCYVVHSWDIGVPPSGMAPRQSIHNVMLHSAQRCLSPLLAHYPQLFVAPFMGKRYFHDSSGSFTRAVVSQQIVDELKLKFKLHCPGMAGRELPQNKGLYSCSFYEKDG